MSTMTIVVDITRAVIGEGWIPRNEALAAHHVEIDVVGINAAVNDAHHDRLLHAKIHRPLLIPVTNACQLDRASSSAYIHRKNQRQTAPDGSIQGVT